MDPKIRLTLRASLLAGFAATLVTLVIVAAAGVYGQQRNLDAMSTLYADRTVPLAQLGTVQYLATRSRLVLMDAVQRADEANTGRRLEAFDAYQKTIDAQWKAYTATFLTPEEAKLVDTTQAALKAYRDEGGPSSKLGFPTADGKSSGSSTVGVFQHGRITCPSSGDCEVDLN